MIARNIDIGEVRGREGGKERGNRMKRNRISISSVVKEEGHKYIIMYIHKSHLPWVAAAAGITSPSASLDPSLSAEGEGPEAAPVPTVAGVGRADWDHSPLNFFFFFLNVYI